MEQKEKLEPDFIIKEKKGIIVIEVKLSDKLKKQIDKELLITSGTLISM